MLIPYYFQSKDAIMLDSLSKVADIVRPIAVKASRSPDQKTLHVTGSALSPTLGCLRRSPDLEGNMLPLQLAGLADLIIRNR